MACRPAGVHSRDEMVYGAPGWGIDVDVNDIEPSPIDPIVAARIGHRIHQTNAGFLGRQLIYMSEGQPPSCTIL